jgi:hypothetical protein
MEWSATRRFSAEIPAGSNAGGGETAPGPEPDIEPDAGPGAELDVDALDIAWSICL